MRRSKVFALFTISDVPYLLPFGQGIADLKRGVQINDTGAYLWELLEEDHTEEELLPLYAAHYEVPDSGLQELKTDLHQFLHMLDYYGMLENSSNTGCTDDPACTGGAVRPDDPDCTGGAVRPDAHCNAGLPVSSGQDNTYVDSPAAHPEMVQRYLSIGGLILLFRGPADAFSQDFDSFEIFPDSYSAPANTSRADSAFSVDQTVTVTYRIPGIRRKCRILLENHELTVMENDSAYIFLFPEAQDILEARLTKDGSDACYYCRAPHTGQLQQDLFHAIRLSFLYLAQLHNMVVLHSASLLYRDRAWLFSGHSGAGKSTHTNLWKDLYGISLINGDLNLLSMENGCPTVHGIPWCGTSGIADTRSYPLGGILFIRQAQQNRVSALDASHAQLLVTQRLISPNWTKELLQENLRLVAELAPHILICRLYCTREPEAAETARQAIHEYLASSANNLI